jgi:NhaP-type Na+/H+ or K+/H+ antiporter
MDESNLVVGLLIITLFIAAFSMLAKRLSTTIFTAPMIFLGFGYLLSKLELIPAIEMQGALHLVAEVALILLLFLDAAKIDIFALKKDFVCPTRMLLVGLPLGMLIGTVFIWFMLLSWP